MNFSQYCRMVAKEADKSRERSTSAPKAAKAEDQPSESARSDKMDDLDETRPDAADSLADMKALIRLLTQHVQRLEADSCDLRERLNILEGSR